MDCIIGWLQEELLYLSSRLRLNLWEVEGFDDFFLSFFTIGSSFICCFSSISYFGKPVLRMSTQMFALLKSMSLGSDLVRCWLCEFSLVYGKKPSCELRLVLKLTNVNLFLSMQSLGFLYWLSIFWKELSLVSDFSLSSEGARYSSSIQFLPFFTPQVRAILNSGSLSCDRISQNWMVFARFSFQRWQFLMDRTLRFDSTVPNAAIFMLFLPCFGGGSISLKTKEVLVSGFICILLLIKNITLSHPPKSLSFIDLYLPFWMDFLLVGLELIITCIIMKMNLNTYLLFLIVLALLPSAQATKTVQSFEELAEYHCQAFPIEGLYRLATGQLAQLYGKQYQELDCYIRQFVNKDGQDPYADEASQDEEEQERSEEEAVPQIDPVVVEYAKGLAACLPESAEPVEAVYAIWRFVRFVVQHDYALEWIRAKIRATLGYQAEKPNAWMDGDQSAPRLRLDKLFSNQFYEYVDQLMFRSFLHPFLTFLNKNVVFAADGQITESGQPILVQYIESKNIRETVFLPVIIQHPQGNIFTYTIPGIPLLLGGSTKDISWAFTGTLVDRSNIEQIQTLGNKFFHRDSEIWIKLQNVTHEIRIKGEEPAECKYVHSNFGTLYEKHKSESGKVSEYITRWHEDQKKVRVIFSELLEVVLTHGQVSKRWEFPFSSLVLTNASGIHQYVCYQQHPSYFLYPDLAGAPEPSSTKWVSNPKRHFIVVSNTHLTTHNPQSYIKREVHNPTEEQFLIEARRRLTASGKFTKESLLQFVTGLNTDPLIKKRKDLLIHIYRKAKFLFFPEEPVRKECDQLIAILEKWDNDLSSTTAPVFILWDYFFREYTFNYVSSEPTGLNIAKHKIVTDVYWTGQMELWKVGTSYGECDSHQWENQYRKKLNGTGENSTCFFNIMRGINRTREVLRNQAGGIREVKLSDFTTPKLYDPANGYLGSHVEEAFKQFFSRNLVFSAELGQNEVIYSQGYLQTPKKADLGSPAPQAESTPAVDTQL